MSEDKKKILDVTTKGWTDKDIAKLTEKVSHYKFRVTFELPDGKVKYAYTNEDKTTTDYMKAFGYKILKVEPI